MRLIFLGSGEFGLPTLKHLSQQHDVAAVISQPDRRAGRGRRLAATPIAAWAQAAGLTVHKTDDADQAQLVSQVRDLHADAAVVVAFGQKLGVPLIDAIGRLAVNLHASLLPKYRGAAPINWAILNGDTQTGVSVISLAQRMDAGLIYAVADTPIDPMETAGELHDRLALMGINLIARVLDDFAAGTLAGQPQDEAQATRAPKLTKADGRVSFDATADEVRRRVHGLTPWPGAHVTWKRRDDATEQPLTLRRVAPEPGTVEQPSPGTILEDHCVAVRDGAVRLLEVQLPGKRVMTIDDFARGHRLRPGDTLLG